jgi:hypothetical protein
VNKKPPVLPDIEDATLRACLAPLMEAMSGTDADAVPPDNAAGLAVLGMARGSNDNPPPTVHETYPEAANTAGDFRELSLLTPDDVGTFRIINVFLAMTDAERASVAAQFPKQIAGTVARVARLKQRVADRYDTVATVLTLLRRAMVPGLMTDPADGPAAARSDPGGAAHDQPIDQ